MRQLSAGAAPMSTVRAAALLLGLMAGVPASAQPMSQAMPGMAMPQPAQPQAPDAGEPAKGVAAPAADAMRGIAAMPGMAMPMPGLMQGMLGRYPMSRESSGTSWQPDSSPGHLHSPEQLEPGVDEQRTTASLTWNRPLGARDNWATTLAWSNKDENPGPALIGLLAESALRLGRHEIFVRAEHERENDLFDAGPLAGGIFSANKVSLGYQQEVGVADHLTFAVGGLASAYAYADRLKASHGSPGVKSFMLYRRLRFGT